MTRTYEFARTWWNCKYNIFEIGQRFFVGHCGSGKTVFGELATLTKITDKHLIFTTDSGKKISTAADNLYIVSGKAGQQGNFVSAITEREYIHSPLFIY